MSLAALSYIDYVIINDNETSVNVIRKLKPNFYFKGKDYKKEKNDVTKNIILEKKALGSNGKFLITNSEVFSSSKIINESFDIYNDQQKKLIKNIKKQYSFNYINKKIEELKNLKILIIGEIIIDNYIFCKTLGKSGKEPFLVLKDNFSEKYLGGAGSMALHLSEFVKQIDLISYVGKNKEELSFIQKSLKKNIKLNLVYKHKSPTIIKRRFVDYDERKKMLGVYSINDDFISKKDEKKILDILKNKIKKYDVVIVPDYGHGLLTDKICNLLCKRSNFIGVNAQINAANTGHHSLEKYNKADCLVINMNELLHETRSQNLRQKFQDEINLKKKKKIKNIVVTKGRSGAYMINQSNKYFSSPSFTKNIVDKIGAGDCLFAFITTLLGSGMREELSLFISSIAAGKNVEAIGNSNLVKKKDLLKSIQYMLK